MPRSRRPGRLLRTLVTGALGVVLVAGILPVPVAAAPSRTQAPSVELVDPPAAEAGKGQRPSEALQSGLER